MRMAQPCRHHRAGRRSKPMTAGKVPSVAPVAVVRRSTFAARVTRRDIIVGGGEMRAENEASALDIARLLLLVIAAAPPSILGP